MTATALLAGSILLSVALSGILAYNNISGWGWFLFVGLMMVFVLADTMRFN